MQTPEKKISVFTNFITAFKNSDILAFWGGTMVWLLFCPSGLTTPLAMSWALLETWRGSKGYLL